MKESNKKILSAFLALCIIVSAFSVGITSDLINALFPKASAATYTMKTSVLYGDHTYALYDNNLSWTSAKAACESMGGHLAVITSSAEQSAINTLVSKSTDSTKKGYWIGATDSEKEGTWKWVTGESFGSYTYWASGEPNNENNAEHYMEISMTNKQWNDDANGASNRGFICEFEDSGVPCAQTVYNGHIYSVYNDSLSWTGAKTFCENIGGHLVTITDQEEQDVVNSLITGQMKGLYWIGASDSETEGTWKWVTDEPFDYSNWGTNEPSGTSSDAQDYAQVYSTDYSSGKPLGCWNDDYNSGNANSDYYRPSNIGFICEVEAEKVSPVARAYLGNNLYELYDCCLTWRDADLYSEMNGGHLCVITDEAENEFVVNLTSKGSAATGYRLGASDEEQEGVWKTVTGESFSYTNWADGEPSSNANKDEDYLEYFKPKSAWNDTKNASPGRGFVVEYENHHETLTYAEKDGSVIASYSVQGNKAVSRPDELEKRGYTTNWYADSNFDVPWDFQNIITEETVIYAERIPHKFTVYFDYNGTTGKISKKTVTFDSKYGVFPTPAREGYTFDGWYSSDGKKIGYSDIVDLDSDITVSANWVPNEYSVSFDLNGGVSESGSESIDPITVIFGSAYGSLPNPTKEGFRFAGWTLNDGTSVYSSSTVNTASDHTLFACWDTRTVTNCELYSLPDKTDYVLGETLNTEGLKIELTYDTGESEVVDCGFDCTPGTFESQGLQTVSVLYYGFTMTFDINVTKGLPCEISISSLPDKTSYFVGEALDTAGLSLLATYLDGSQDTITSGFECSVSTLKREGTQRVIVSYGECSAVFNVTVSCGSIVGISIDTLPEKLQYYVGEKLDTSGLSLRVEYQGSVFKTISDGFTASCDLTSAGTKEVTVNYSENGVTVSTKYSVDVSESDIACVSSPELSVVSGETLSIPFSINNCKGFMGFGIIIEYDETAFSPISVASGDILSNGTLSDNIEANDSSLVIMYVDSENVTSDGTLFTVDFAVNETADGIYHFNLSYKSYDTFNEDWEEVKLIFNTGDVTVINSSAADDSVRFYSDPISAQSDSSVTVPLLVENGVGMDSFVMKMSFDQSVFTFAGVEAGEILNGTKPHAIIDASNNLYFKWTGSCLEQDGILFYITFEIADYVKSEETVAVFCNNISFADGSTKQTECSDIIIDISNKYESEMPTVYSVDDVLLSGNIIEIPVMIQNNHGLMGFGFNIDYDNSVLTPIDIEKGEMVSEGIFENNLESCTDRIKIVWNKTQNIYGDGLLFTVAFSIAEGVKPETVPITVSYSQDNTFDEQWKDVELNMNIGEIPTTYMNLTVPKTRLKIGELTKISAVYKHGSSYGKITFSSTNPSVATISQSGVLTALKGGSTTIIAKTNDGRFTKSAVINVAFDNPVIRIINCSGSNEQKLDWWKPYSSATMSLDYKAYNCDGAVTFKWSSSNKKVQVDENGTVTNTGNFARSAKITVSAYDADGNVIARGSIKIKFYKFDWQAERLQTQSFVSDDASQVSGYGEIDNLASIVKNFFCLLNTAFN